DGAEVAGEGCAEVAAETFVEGFEGAHLIFGDAFGAFEVVDVDVEAGGPAGAGEDGGRADASARAADAAGVDLAGIYRGEECVDFGLIQDVGHPCPWESSDF